MRIENTPAYCPGCHELKNNDFEVERCIKNHKLNEKKEYENDK